MALCREFRDAFTDGFSVLKNVLLDVFLPLSNLARYYTTTSFFYTGKTKPHTVSTQNPKYIQTQGVTYKEENYWYKINYKTSYTNDEYKLRNRC